MEKIMYENENTFPNPHWIFFAKDNQNNVIHINFITYAVH